MHANTVYTYTPRNILLAAPQPEFFAIHQQGFALILAEYFTTLLGRNSASFKSSFKLRTRQIFNKVNLETLARSFQKPNVSDSDHCPAGTTNCVQFSAV